MSHQDQAPEECRALGFESVEGARDHKDWLRRERQRHQSALVYQCSEDAAALRLEAGVPAGTWVEPPPPAVPVGELRRGREVDEDYRGHVIGNALKPVARCNKVSGHEWTEHEVLPTLAVKGPSHFSWTGRRYRSVKAARSDIDYAIKYDPRCQLQISPEDAAAIVREHFQMDRVPTSAEVEDLLVSLVSKRDDGFLDERSEMLASRLGLFDVESSAPRSERPRG